MLKLITELTFISNKKEKNVCFVSKICHLSQSSLNPLPELLFEFIVSGVGVAMRSCEHQRATLGFMVPVPRLDLHIQDSLLWTRSVGSSPAGCCGQHLHSSSALWIHCAAQAGLNPSILLLQSPCCGVPPC